MRDAAMRHAALAALLAGALAGSYGCSDKFRGITSTEIQRSGDDTPTPSRHVDAQHGETPSGLATVSFANSSLRLWPYTGESLNGTPTDPVNLIFVGNVDPLKIRAALLSLDANRAPFPPVYPFNARWSDAIGNAQTQYSEGKGWQGSVVQLQLGSYGPVRIHLRLWRTGELFGSHGTWTVGAVHFDLQIPGTADHEVVAWELPQQVVVADMVRTGLLDPGTPLATTTVINQTPTFRTIAPPIYNGMPDALKGLLGLPLGSSAVPVGIPNDGRATVLHVTGVAPAQNGHFSDVFSITYNQIIPKPFCSDGPLDYVRVSGPVTLSRSTEVSDNGHYRYHSQITGQITVTPVDVTKNPPVASGPSFVAEVSDLQQGFLIPGHSWLTAESKRVLPQETGTEMFMSKLRVDSQGQQSYRVWTDCLAGPLP